MVKNVRWLYSKLGTEDFSITGSDTVSGSLNNLQSELDGKSPSSHTHSTSSLPVSNNQVNSANYIPTSALLYSMSQRADGIQDLVNLAKTSLDDPNKRYESKNLGTLSSANDVDTFLSTYTHANNYEGLSLGNYFTIQDGAYNTVWKIAGFDMEYCQLAADGTVYDNGYGICLVPLNLVPTVSNAKQWNTSMSTSGGYISSYVHNTILPNIVTTFKTVLEDHIVNRNVLLSSSVSGSSSTAYTWTTAYATLMSIGQMKGTFASHNTKYDDGEANYKLPLFNYEAFKATSSFWVRGVGDIYTVWTVMDNGDTGTTNANSSRSIRPMIYIR